MRGLTAAVAAAILAASATGCGSAQSGPPDQPPTVVTIAQPVRKRTVEWDAYTGRLEPVDFVEVRARVSGYLQTIHFEEGQPVKEGELLCVIDPRPFEAELNRATAALRQAESQLLQAQAQLATANAQKLQSDAQLQLAQTRVERARLLSRRDATTQEDVDQREADLLQAQADLEASNAGISSAEAAIATANASVEAAKAGVEAAQLDLDYTKIHAPISGLISQENVTEGNYISGGTATSTLLTSIASVDPIYCTFDVNEQEVLKYVRLAQEGRRQSSRVARNPVFLGLIDESGFPHEGHMDFVDNRFDPSTASMRARGVFPNDDQVLLPGMFARIRIPGSAPYEAVLIPDSAVGTDQSSQYVYIVQDGVIERRGVTLGPIVDGLRVVRNGLSGNEQLVIEGLLQSRPGMEVETQDGTIEVVEDGLPDDYSPLPPEDSLSPKPDPLPEGYTSQVVGEPIAEGAAQ
ncbi:Efflux pump periplasmic linker BepF [Maioricimonas rarisocia]|uniref:Efflux pump periplasmic linker BepF n=1 Tax=Maioricimonas rarisocia TaxID=2528026 RepID=A0A517ZAR3_9PLAN|nr:efflux RND transporter periplasmic adaptor subunit [Maioricimonas rarisocia]QDU39530.1 Efflux pump periplasmic linker BepF [Maioricimonas rarisocia]